MKIDNSTKAFILVVAIVLSVGFLMYNSGILKTVTGGATTEQGTANFSITSQVSILLVDDISNLGNGYVDDGAAEANISSENTEQQWTGTTYDDPMFLANNGNTNANITIKMDTAVATWIGGTSGSGPHFWFKMENATSNTSPCTRDEVTAWTELTSTTLYKQGCSNLTFKDAGDTVELNFQAGIPSDATPATKSTTITLQAAAAI